MSARIAAAAGGIRPRRKVVFPGSYGSAVGSFERSVLVAAPKADVWARIVSPEGINDEMRPWITMRLPRSTHGLTIETLPIGKALGRAWIMLFGLIPVDYDRLVIAGLEPGHFFHEKSTMLSMRRWEHRRTLTPIGAGTTRITDYIVLVPRLGLMTPIMTRLLYAFFGHRHRRLRRHFHS